MKRPHLFIFVVTVAFGTTTLLLHADVKTRQKTLVKVEGMMGRIMAMGGGAAAKDGLTSTVAVKGNRKASINDANGQIIDLAEEKVYEIDVKKKEYRVTTFAEMRERLKKAQADMEKQAQGMPAEERAEMQESGKQMEIDVDVKETGEKKSIAGHPVKQVIVTITAREKGKTLNEGGGVVMTNDVWLGPRVAALDEIWQFDLKFFKAVYGDMPVMMQGMEALGAMIPGLKAMSERLEPEMRKLDGTTFMGTMTMETVKSDAVMKQTQAPPSGGGGLGGALGRKLLGNRGTPQQRSKLFTSTNETLSIDTSAAAADVAVPAGYKEKK